VIICLYKKSFLKDLAKLPKPYRKSIERLVFEEIPKLNNLFAELDIVKMKGYQDYYRIRVGDYRIGCRVKEGNQIVFYRVKSRAEIYKVFPR
jgi:mRNA interferase RelE/StbE